MLEAIPVHIQILCEEETPIDLQAHGRLQDHSESDSWRCNDRMSLDRAEDLPDTMANWETSAIDEAETMTGNDRHRRHLSFEVLQYGGEQICLVDSMRRLPFTEVMRVRSHEQKPSPSGTVWYSCRNDTSDVYFSSPFLRSLRNFK